MIAGLPNSPGQENRHRESKPTRVDSELAKKLEDYFRTEGAEIAYLFGSRATGREHPESDYDLAVLWAEPFDPLEGLRLAARMERELAAICAAEVDLVFLNQASPLLMFEVIRHGLVLFSKDEERRILTELRARAAYEDYVHFQSFFVRALKEELAS